MSAVFTARRSGSCAACPDGIEEGQTVTWSDDDHVIHLSCAQEQKAMPKAEREICGSCFLEKPVNGQCCEE